MTDNTYNGWSNYETWNCALWIDNDQGQQAHANEQAREILERNDWDKDAARGDLAYALESMIDEQTPDLPASMFSDLLRAAIGAIDWRELADHYLTDIDVYSAGWNMPGYMPDSDPQLFGDADDAREYIADEIERYADEQDDECDADALAIIRDAAESCRDGSGEYGNTVGEYHYFVTRV